MTTVTRLADELLDAIHEHHPLFATLSGFRDRDDRLSDYSQAGEASTAARLADILARTQALNPTGLPLSDRLACAVVRAHAEATLDQLTAHSVEYTITPLYAAPAAQLLFGLPMTGIAETAHAEGYLARLRGIPSMLATLADRHRAGVPRAACWCGAWSTPRSPISTGTWPTGTATRCGGPSRSPMTLAPTPLPPAAPSAARRSWPNETG